MVLAVGPPSCGVLTQKDYNIVTQEGGKTLAEFPNSIEIGKWRKIKKNEKGGGEGGGDHYEC
jgi:hypothetical protein